MKKIFLIVLLLTSSIIITGCTKKKDNNAALAFKNDYESVNGKTNSKGAEYRIVNIPEKNPYEKITTKELINKIENKETFYVYFGDKLCPWCRSVIEKSIEIANKKKIEKIYYINIWNDEGKEILRDKFELIDDKLTKTLDGTPEYQKLLEFFKNVLSDYELINSKGKKVSTGEKRIYAPNFIYIEKGEAIKLVEGTSDKQTDSYEKLTTEILKDEEKAFEEFFND